MIFGTLFVLLAGGVSYRLYDLQIRRHERYAKRADQQHHRRAVLQPERGDILDRTGRALAQSTGRLTFYVNPKFLIPEVLAGSKETDLPPIDFDQLAAAIAPILDLPTADLYAKLRGKRTTPLAKRIRTDAANRLMAAFSEREIDGRGFWVERESVRLYPSGVASPVLGFCSKDEGGDNTGIAGLELSYNEELSGEWVETRVPRTGISQALSPWKTEDLLAARGNTLTLTLDLQLQQAMETTLAESVKEWEAASAGAVVLDARTGAVLAMASYPTFNNNEFTKASPDSLRNRVLTDPLETGSVAKLFTAAILIDQGHITPDTLVDCEGGYAVVDGRRLTDSPGHAPLHLVPFHESLRWSSNVGIVKVAQALENRSWHKALKSLGFGAPTGIDLPGEGAGILYPVERWTKFSRTSLPMGYELALTPIQIAAAVAAIANGGEYHTPYLVEQIRDSRGNIVYQHDHKMARQVIRQTTSAIMREMMQDIVDNGTGKKAIIKGYRVGGKTGTTRKSNIFDRREYIASFGGVLPADDPRLSIYLYIDAPQKAYYAGTVAAPAFQKIARAAAVHLGIAPSQLAEVPPNPEDEAPIVPVVRDFGLHAMPDFTGLSMAEARELLPEREMPVKLLGTGLAVDQFPPPGDPIGKNTEIVLHFATTPKGDAP